MSKYYIYELLDNGIPFYVGKGSGKRIEKHERLAKNGKLSRVCNHICEIWNSGRLFETRIISTFDSERDAFSAEKQRISEIGIDNLENLVPGGGGVISEEVFNAMRKKISLALKGRKQSPEHRAKLSAVRKGRGHPHTEEDKLKISKALSGKKQSKSHLEKLYASRLGRHTPGFAGKHHTEESRNRMTIKRTGKKMSESFSKKLSERNRSKIVKREYRAPRTMREMLEMNG